MLQTQSFELIREEQIKEVNSLARLYRHKKTGAEVLSLINDDENKVFGITFKTPPEDSTGVAHILEHSVLCGSRKYPVKKPFVELLKGSLHTFLNAMTFPDKTAYPVASQNLQDFYNLVDVYLDAVFFPLITRGHVPAGGLALRARGQQRAAGLQGRGVQRDEGRLFVARRDARQGVSQLSLYPDNAYGVNSGGDPKAIPDLTYEYFKNFHAKYYHPSNARIVFYGDDDPEQRLEILDGVPEPVRADRRRCSGEAAAALERAAAARRRPMPRARPRPARRPAWSRSTGCSTRSTIPRPTLALNVLEHVLVGNPAAPLRKALTDSGLGEGLTGSGLADDYPPARFHRRAQGHRRGRRRQGRGADPRDAATSSPTRASTRRPSKRR